MLEVLQIPQISTLKCVVLDYDGTLTTFRRGWEKILHAFASAKICDHEDFAAGNKEAALDDIDYFVAHAGGSNPRQLMSRLIELAKKYLFSVEMDLQSCAEEYVEVFHQAINKRLNKCYENGESYLIKGTRQMLDFLNQRQIQCYVVTGSAENDVRNELEILQLGHHFCDVYGATLNTSGRHKEEALADIISLHSYKKCEMLMVGDGSVEIEAACNFGLPSLGIASDEHNGGLCERKRRHLIDAGAQLIAADYQHFPQMWNTMHEFKLQ